MIPKNPTILLSFINTQLRDNYSSLEDLCQSLDINQAELEKQLASIDYSYDRKQHQFI